MHTNRTRTLNASIALILFAAAAGALTGCGGDTVKARNTEPESRARLVADAWDGSRAAEAWRRGYFPMGDAVQLPANGFRTQADRRAYTTQNVVPRGELPATPHGGGQVRWRSGGSPPLSAADRAHPRGVSSWARAAEADQGGRGRPVHHRAGRPRIL
ncbi:hypothetical protein [Streptomyces sp. MK37H]|uniref:hypothetical protein n=1 Tax=Streptomyces sp. MK37H TaxID=2699117 RepID=UPI001FFABDBD|nr:hypothetical protein [Streptomyces sp. MK37H]